VGGRPRRVQPSVDWQERSRSGRLACGWDAAGPSGQCGTRLASLKGAAMNKWTVLSMALVCAMSAVAQTPAADKPLTQEQIASSTLPIQKSPWCTLAPGETKVLSSSDTDQERSTACMNSGLTTAQCHGKKVETSCACYQKSEVSGAIVHCGTAFFIDGYNLRRERSGAEKERQRKQQEEAKAQQEKSGVVKCTLNGMPVGGVKLASEDNSHCHSPKKGEPGYLPWN
jgi:hypothetical protein